MDGSSRLIVAVDVSANPADYGRLEEMLDQVQENLGASPDKVLADSGYASERTLAELERRGVDAYLALGREGKPGASARTPARARMADKIAAAEGRKTTPLASTSPNLRSAG